MYREYVPEVLEKVQIMEKQILRKFIEICQKYDLKYFAAFGTLLGVVRHHGFIPWDDDIDVAMPRKDYERFLQVASLECGEDFFVQTPENDPEYHLFFAKMRMENTVFIESSLQKSGSRSGFYIDIFPYDAIPDSEDEMRAQICKAERLAAFLSISRSKEPQMGPHGALTAELLKIIWKTLHYGMRIFRVTGDKIWKQCQENFIRYEDTNAKRRTCFCMDAEKWIVFEDEIINLLDMPFEDMTVKVPVGYDQILKRNYGNYWELPPKEQRVNHMPAAIQFPGEKLIRY